MYKYSSKFNFTIKKKERKHSVALTSDQTDVSHKEQNPRKSVNYYYMWCKCSHAVCHHQGKNKTKQNKKQTISNSSLDSSKPVHILHIHPPITQDTKPVSQVHHRPLKVLIYILYYYFLEYPSNQMD